MESPRTEATLRGVDKFRKPYQAVDQSSVKIHLVLFGFFVTYEEGSSLTRHFFGTDLAIKAEVGMVQHDVRIQSPLFHEIRTKWAQLHVSQVDETKSKIKTMTKKQYSNS